MALLFTNTLTRKKEVFTPLRKGEVRMYNCGPTVYNYAHIGNFRAYIFADLLRRYLEWKGYRVKQIMNITDVGHMTVDDSLEGGGVDKIEKSAQERGLSPKEIADFYTMAFFEDISKLNIQKAYFYPRATDHIGEMQEIISKLLERGCAYKRGGNVYFDIKKFPHYGKLSGNTMKKLQAGKRIAVREEKKNPFDFALWIENPNHIMQWPSPWGRGYPGWHIECSAMSMTYLGETIDIHTGGEDNIFPHHECEIAQSEGFTGKGFVNYWLHTRHLLVNGKKMSKSLGNFYTLRDLLEKGYSPRAIRFLLLSAHYRTRLNFTEKGLKGAEETVRGLDDFVRSLEGLQGKKNRKIPALIQKTRKEFEKAMDGDLNISQALAVIFGFMRGVNGLIARKQVGEKNTREILTFISDIDQVLGLDIGKGAGEMSPEIQELLQQREEFRRQRKWKEADRIREVIRKRGFSVEDTERGPKAEKR